RTAARVDAARPPSRRRARHCGRSLAARAPLGCRAAGESRAGGVRRHGRVRLQHAVLSEQQGAWRDDDRARRVARLLRDVARAALAVEARAEHVLAAWTAYNPRMKHRSSIIVAWATALTLGLAAQTRAPQNDSIRQDDLRADLFFVAGDSLRG